MYMSNKLFVYSYEQDWLSRPLYNLAQQFLNSSRPMLFSINYLAFSKSYYWPSAATAVQSSYPTCNSFCRSAPFLHTKTSAQLERMKGLQPIFNIQGEQ